MSIYKMQTGKWRAQVGSGSSRRTKSFDNEADAKEWFDEKQKELLNGKDIPLSKVSKALTLKEAFEMTFNDVEGDIDPKKRWCNSEHGRRQKYYVKQMLEFFGQNVLLREITKDKWKKFAETFPETATRNRRSSCINKIFNYVFNAGGITKEHYVQMHKFKEDEASRAYAFSVEEENAIYEVCDQLGYTDLKDFVQVLIDTGGRAQELIFATPRQLIKFRGNEIILNLNNFKTDTKKLVGLKKRSQAILLRRSNQPRFFNFSYKQLRRKWHNVRVRLGQENNPVWVFHTCRHTCASRLAQAGCTLVEIAEWLGHAPNSPVTKRYLHFFPKTKINIAKRLDDLDKKYQDEIDNDNDVEQKDETNNVVEWKKKKA